MPNALSGNLCSAVMDNAVAAAFEGVGSLSKISFGLVSYVAVRTTDRWKHLPQVLRLTMAKASQRFIELLAPREAGSEPIPIKRWLSGELTKFKTSSSYGLHSITKLLYCGSFESTDVRNANDWISGKIISKKDFGHDLKTLMRSERNRRAID